MYVPNYIPQPLEVPGNVSLEPWDRKLVFLRRATCWHLASLGALILLIYAGLPAASLAVSTTLLLSVLGILCVVRIATRGTSWDVPISTVLFPAALVALAMVANAMLRAGLPAWSVLAGVVGTTVYTAACGRDFSFVGQYLLSLIASEVALAVIAPIAHMSPIQAAWAMGLNAVYLTYFCYDLASLMSRRRFGETLGAMVDLYRDVLNVFGWIVRCVRHWRRHRIWAAPWG